MTAYLDSLFNLKSIVRLIFLGMPIFYSVGLADTSISNQVDATSNGSVLSAETTNSKLKFPYGESYNDNYKLSFEDEEYTVTSFTSNSEGKNIVEVKTITPTPTTLYTDKDKYSQLLNMYSFFLNDLSFILDQAKVAPWTSAEFDAMLNEVASNPYAEIQVQLAKTPNSYNFEETYSERIKSGYKSNKFESPFSDFKKFIVSEMEQFPFASFKVEISKDGLVEKYILSDDKSSYIEIFYKDAREQKNIVKIVKTNPLNYTDYESGYTSEGIFKEVYASDVKNGISMSVTSYFAPRTVEHINNESFTAQFDAKYLCFLMEINNFNETQVRKSFIKSISIDARPQFSKEWIERNCIEYSDSAPEMTNFKNLSPEFISTELALPGFEQASISLVKSTKEENTSSYKISQISAQIDSRGQNSRGYYLSSKNYFITANKPYFDSDYALEERNFYNNFLKDYNLANIGGATAYVNNVFNAPSLSDPSKSNIESVIGKLISERYLRSATYSQTAISYDEFNSYVQEGTAFNKDITLDHSLSVQYKISKSQSEEYRRVPQSIELNRTGIKPFKKQ